MAKAKKSRDGAGVSPELRSAIAAEAISCFVDDVVLVKRDVAVLRGILAGEVDPSFPVSTKRALGALARSDASEETADLLGRVLANRKAPPPDRAAAAAYLAELPAKLAEKPLIGALGKTAGPLRVTVIRSLGQIGSAKALKALEKLDPDKEDVARRPLALARLAIALREKPDGLAPADLDEGLDIRWTSDAAKPLDAKTVAATIAALARPAFGVELNSEAGFRFACAGVDHVVLLNAALKRGGFAKQVGKRAMIAALIVARPERVDHFAVRWALLTSPGKGVVRMVLVRPNGEPAFEGNAVADGKGFSFTLRDTGLERAPAEIGGRIDEDGIDWTIRAWRGPLRVKRSPLSMPISLQR